ncbi:hypothetical protein ACU635_43605 [[Actinomadura] parvosata]
MSEAHATPEQRAWEERCTDAGVLHEAAGTWQKVEGGWTYTVDGGDAR